MATVSFDPTPHYLTIRDSTGFIPVRIEFGKGRPPRCVIEFDGDPDLLNQAITALEWAKGEVAARKEPMM